MYSSTDSRYVYPYTHVPVRYGPFPSPLTSPLPPFQSGISASLLSYCCAYFGSLLSPFARSWLKLIAAYILILILLEYYSRETQSSITSIPLSQGKVLPVCGIFWKVFNSIWSVHCLLLFLIMVLSLYLGFSLCSWSLIYMSPVQRRLLRFKCLTWPGSPVG